MICILPWACGSSDPSKDSSQNTKPSAEEQVEPIKTQMELLDFRIVGEGPTTPSNPDANWKDANWKNSESAKHDRRLRLKILGRDTVAFPHPLTLKDRSLFLIWADQVSGTPVSAAHYTYEVQDQHNIRRAFLQPTPAAKDAAQKIWFLPFPELFKTLEEQGYSYSSTDIHLLKLDLVLGYARHEAIEVRFKVYATAPKI